MKMKRQDELEIIINKMMDDIKHKTFGSYRRIDGLALYDELFNELMKVKPYIEEYEDL